MMKTPISALFFDIDGTILSFKTHSVPRSTEEAVAEVRARGVKTFICTGRPRSLFPDFGRLEFDGYVTTNGTCCLDADFRPIYKCVIPEDDIERAIDFHHRHAVPFVFVTEDEFILTDVDDRVRQTAELLALTLPPPVPIEEVRGKSIIQAMAFLSPEEEEENGLFRDVIRGALPQRWSPLFCDIVVDGVDKATGIDHMAAHYGLRREEIMAFGDGGNDIPMLRHVGCGVAMGNAADDVKQAADYVTSAIDDDGVARALQHFGLI